MNKIGWASFENQSEIILIRRSFSKMAARTAGLVIRCDGPGTAAIIEMYLLALYLMRLFPKLA
jgi:hypothetical protein